MVGLFHPKVIVTHGKQTAFDCVSKLSDDQEILNLSTLVDISLLSGTLPLSRSSSHSLQSAIFLYPTLS